MNNIKTFKVYPVKETDIRRKKCFLFVCFATGISLFTLVVYFNPFETKFNTALPPIKGFRYEPDTFKENISPKNKETKPLIKTFTYKPTTFKENISTKNKETKLILIYTAFFNAKPWQFVKEDKDYGSKCNCDFSNCKLTYDANLFTKSDAVVFHARDMPNNGELDRLTRSRKFNQKWVYYVLEQPGNAADVRPLDKYFNWTASYRLNSDAQMPYSRFESINTNKNPSPINYAKDKTKQIAWLVSHCGTARDRFVKKLEEYSIQIDVGGGCGRNFKNQLQCRERSCKEELQKYKFYFSAENGLCKDYITEKYFGQGFIGNTVPIVFGGSNYSNPKLAIPGSFINPFDFKNMKEFADYLKMLDKNDDKYNEYFKWKSHWKMTTQPDGCEKFICQLCQNLHDNNYPKDRSISSQISGDCDKPARHFEEWIKL